MRQARELDVVLFGATGFTGRLVAEYLLDHYGTNGLRWALAGRDSSKLEQLRQSLGPKAQSLPLIVANVFEPHSLVAMARRATVVCTTVGPYARYGSELVAACAREGTSYCDLTGEPHWIRAMIDAHEATAKASGARLVPCCGFDSIPSDLGVLFAQKSSQERFGAPSPEVKMRVRHLRGGISGGTAATLLANAKDSRHDPTIQWALAHPYALNPRGEQEGPASTDPLGPRWDPELGSWVAPFVMASVNTKVVRRTNALLGYSYGRQFRYEEAVLTGSGMRGLTRASVITAGLAALLVGVRTRPLRPLIARLLPRPGEGPSARRRESGSFELLFVVKDPRNPSNSIRVEVRAERDPGYGATSRMLAESAVCLAKDEEPARKPGGFWTPASCLGFALLERLQRNAGITFRVREER